MKTLAAALAAVSLSACAYAQQEAGPARVAPPDVRAIAPALADYTDEVLFGDVWRRTDLSPRDRSIVTISALIAGGHTAQMTGHFNRALDNGVKPSEIAGVITHLAFYSGWPRAMSAVPVAKDVFAQRGVSPGEGALASAEPAPVDAAAEAARAATTEAVLGETTPALAGYTNDVVFGDLWRRTDISPRDRSLATISALIAGGHVDQLKYHIERGRKNGLSQVEISEAITHLAFYAGWPPAMSAVPVAKVAFEAPAEDQQPPGDRSTQRAPTLEIQRFAAEPPAKGAADNFTGSVTVDSSFRRTVPSRVGGAVVSFEPDARTAWHTHSLGQTLVVTEGCGWVQQEGGTVETIRPGDVVLIPPGVRHWHGATQTTAMTHVAISEALDGKSVDWMEQVSDQQYRGGGRSGSC